jgi:hypothetical protein
MPQGIYTGQGLRAPRTPAYALQALSQFGIQEQARKTAEIEKSYKERQNFIDVLKLDPVYLASTEAQGKMAQSVDDFVNQATMMYRKSGGRLSTQDLAKLQQARGAVMAEMQYRKSIDNAMLDAQQKVSQRPDLWSQEKLDKEVQEYRSTGMHDGNFLFPAFKDPFVYAQRMAEQYIADPNVTVSAQRAGPNAALVTTVSTPQGRITEDEMIARSAAGPNQVHIQDAFDMPQYISPERREEYVQRGEEMGVDPANLWYYEENKGSILTPSVKKEQRLYRERVGAAGVGLRGTSIKDDRYTYTSIQSGVPVLEGSLDKAIVFDPYQAERHTTSLPKGTLILGEGIEVSTPSVKAYPYAADNNKTYWIVERNSLDRVSFTESAMEAFDKDSFEKVGGKWRIKEGYEADVMLPTNTSDIIGLINAWTGDSFEEQLKLLPQNEEQIKL